jgi:hypothetical protein
LVMFFADMFNNNHFPNTTKSGICFKKKQPSSLLAAKGLLNKRV